MPLSESDETLMVRISEGDPEALRLLYRRHGARVFGLAVHILRDSALAEEATQDVFLRVWSKARMFRSAKAAVLTWVLRIARNRSIDLLRQHQINHSLPEDLVSSHPGPEDVFEDAVTVDGVRSRLARLPVAQRKVLAMSYYQGLSHREISLALGEPLGTVKSRIREALLGLRKRGLG